MFSFLISRVECFPPRGVSQQATARCFCLLFASLPSCSTPHLSFFRGCSVFLDSLYLCAWRQAYFLCLFTPPIYITLLTPLQGTLELKELKKQTNKQLLHFLQFSGTTSSQHLLSVTESSIRDPIRAHLRNAKVSKQVYPQLSDNQVLEKESNGAQLTIL